MDRAAARERDSGRLKRDAQRVAGRNTSVDLPAVEDAARIERDRGRAADLEKARARHGGDIGRDRLITDETRGGLVAVLSRITDKRVRSRGEIECGRR